jgi:hypothetical protein
MNHREFKLTVKKAVLAKQGNVKWTFRFKGQTMTFTEEKYLDLIGGKTFTYETPNMEINDDKAFVTLDISNFKPEVILTEIIHTETKMKLGEKFEGSEYRDHIE